MIKKKVLITNGSHPLAIYLAKELLEAGHAVTLISSFSTHKNILDLQGYCEFHYLQHNISCALYLDVDEVYNLSSCLQKTGDPILSEMKEIIFGTYNILALAKRAKAKVLHLIREENACLQEPIRQAYAIAYAFCNEFQKKNVLVTKAEILGQDLELIESKIAALQVVANKNGSSPCSFFSSYAQKLRRFMEEATLTAKTRCF